MIHVCLAVTYQYVYILLKISFSTCRQDNISHFFTYNLKHFPGSSVHFVSGSMPVVVNIMKRLWLTSNKEKLMVVGSYEENGK